MGPLELEQLRAKIFQKQDLVFLIYFIFHTGIEMNQHIQGTFEPAVFTFDGPSLNLEGNWP